MFMKLGQHSSGIPATPALLETVSALAHQRLGTSSTGQNRLVLPSFKGNYVESNLSLILVERPFRSGLLPELITSCTTSSMTELAAELAACPLLAPNWRALFNRAMRDKSGLPTSPESG